MSNKVKTESIADFLARGGVIRVVPSVKETNSETTRSSAAGGPVKILTLEEADLYLGEKRKKTKTKKASKIDVSALPEELRKKFITQFEEGKISGSKQEEDK